MQPYKKKLLAGVKLFAAGLLCALMLAGAATGSYAQDSTQIKAWEKAADQGDANSQDNLGNAYRQGWGVVQSDEEALKWYRKAAEQGNAEAQFNLGLAYSMGHGVGRDYKEALKWYRKAAEQGNAAAQYALGEAYHSGYGVEKNDKEAIIFYQKAAFQGNASASTVLTSMETQQQSALFQARVVPGTLWLAIFLASVMSIIVFLLQMRRDGTEQYELNFFKSLQFCVLVSGAIVFYAVGMFFGNSGLIIAECVAVVTIAIALTVNIKRSSPSFGALYTLAQAITAYMFFLWFVLEIFKRSDRRRPIKTDVPHRR